MVDYKCPNCGGGFPSSAATDDECPWCARGMKGDSGTVTTVPTHRTVPTNRTVSSDVFDNRTTITGDERIGEEL